MYSMIYAIPGNADMIISIIIFIITLILVITEVVHRSIAVIAGATALLAIGILDVEEAIGYVDFETLLLLLGMMTMMEVLKELGLFHYIAIKIAKYAGGYKKFFILITLAAGGLSPFLDSVTVVLIFSTIIVAISRIINKDPRPLLLSQVFASNIGGNATLIGEPTNIIVGTHAKLTFIDFMYALTPVSIINLPLAVYLLTRIFRIEDEDISMYVDALDEYSFVKDMNLLKRATYIFIFTLILFFLHGVIHVSPAVVALIGTSLMLLVIRPDIVEVLSKLEWGTILFIGGFFVIVGAMMETGALKMVTSAFLLLPSDDITILSLIIGYISAFASGFIDNIPYVTMMLPVVDELNIVYGTEYLWWILLVGANFGGNFTPIAASPNIVVIAISEREHVGISFMSFMKVGLLIGIITLTVALLTLTLQLMVGML